MFPSYEDIATEIRTKQHAVVPFPLSHAELGRAMDVFIDFLTLPQETKDVVYHQIDPTNRGNEVGYKLYKRDLGNTDNREYFHYHAIAEKQFADHIAAILELKRLMDAMRPVYEAACDAFSQTMDQFETRFSGIHDKFFSTNGPPHFYLRFLKYDRLKPGEFLAKGHYDRGTCTLALAESAPGLRMGLDANTVKLVRHDDGKALFMPDLLFRDLTSAEFPPTWHDVVQQDTDVFREDIARWAIVFFCDHELKTCISYMEAHTPLSQKNA